MSQKNKKKKTLEEAQKRTDEQSKSCRGGVENLQWQGKKVENVSGNAKRNEGERKKLSHEIKERQGAVKEEEEDMRQEMGCGRWRLGWK